MSLLPVPPVVKTHLTLKERLDFYMDSEGVSLQNRNGRQIHAAFEGHISERILPRVPFPAVWMPSVLHGARILVNVISVNPNDTNFIALVEPSHPFTADFGTTKVPRDTLHAKFQGQSLASLVELYPTYGESGLELGPTADQLAVDLDHVRFFYTHVWPAAARGGPASGSGASARLVNGNGNGNGNGMALTPRELLGEASSAVFPFGENASAAHHDHRPPSQTARTPTPRTPHSPAHALSESLSDTLSDITLSSATIVGTVRAFYHVPFVVDEYSGDSATMDKVADLLGNVPGEAEGPESDTDVATRAQLPTDAMLDGWLYAVAAVMYPCVLYFSYCDPHAPFNVWALSWFRTVVWYGTVGLINLDPFSVDAIQLFFFRRLVLFGTVGLHVLWTGLTWYWIRSKSAGGTRTPSGAMWAWLLHSAIFGWFSFSRLLDAGTPSYGLLDPQVSTYVPRGLGQHAAALGQHGATGTRLKVE